MMSHADWLGKEYLDGLIGLLGWVTVFSTELSLISIQHTVVHFFSIHLIIEFLLSLLYDISPSIMLMPLKCRGRPSVGGLCTASFSTRTTSLYIHLTSWIETSLLAYFAVFALKMSRTRWIDLPSKCLKRNWQACYVLCFDNILIASCNSNDDGLFLHWCILSLFYDENENKKTNDVSLLLYYNLYSNTFNGHGCRQFDVELDLYMHLQA